MAILLLSVSIGMSLDILLRNDGTHFSASQYKLHQNCYNTSISCKGGVFYYSAMYSYEYKSYN